MDRYLRRQELAQAEIGQTDVSAAVARGLVVAGLMSLLAVPIARSLLPTPDLRRTAAPFGSFRQALGPAFATPGLVSKDHAVLERMDELERRLEEESIVMELVLRPAQWLLSGLGGVGNEEVYLGRDRWLYLRPGVDYLTGPGFLTPRALKRRSQAGPAWLRPPQPNPLPALLDFQRQLQARGIRLLVLPAPAKAMIHPEALSRRALQGPATGGPLLRNSSFEAFRTELETHGVLVFDPTGTLVRVPRYTGREAFLRTDSHWSPEGVDAVAKELAARIRLLELPFEDDSSPFRRDQLMHSGGGDLVGALRLPSWQNLFPRETVQIAPVVGIRPQGEPGEDAEILVLGDSFTNVYSQGLDWGTDAGLAEQLAFHLERRVDRLAVNAGGASGSRQLLAREPARLARTKLVVFQFAMRELAVGDWLLITLPAHPSEPNADDRVATSEGSILP
ncbi:MAG: hypothetical protein GY856_51550 [bacterium]|nr:hypothetical protein [bacterium]